MTRELRGGEAGACCDGGGGGTAGTDTLCVQFGDPGGLPQNSYLRAAGAVMTTVAGGAPIPAGATIVRWVWRSRNPPSNPLNTLNFSLEVNGTQVATTALPGGTPTFSFDLTLAVVALDPGDGVAYVAVRSGSYSVGTDRPQHSQTSVWYRMPTP